jgi:hypothetical protein
MLFMFPGSISATELEAELKPFFELLKRERLDRVEGLRISFWGWRGGERCQIRGEDGLISVVNFDLPESGRERVVRSGTTIRERPADLEDHPFATLFNHDD